MPVKDFFEFFIGIDILREEKCIKLIHDESEGVFDSKRLLRRMRRVL
jgi:uncharacterized protein YqfB (UPF0267 family)